MFLRVYEWAGALCWYIGAFGIENTTNEDTLFKNLGEYMGEEDMEDAARSNVRTGELDLRKMEPDSILTLGESSTASAGLLTPRKSLEMEAQLLRGRI